MERRLGTSRSRVAPKHAHWALTPASRQRFQKAIPKMTSRGNPSPGRFGSHDNISTQVLRPKTRVYCRRLGKLHGLESIQTIQHQSSNDPESIQGIETPERGTSWFASSNRTEEVRAITSRFIRLKILDRTRLRSGLFRGFLWWKCRESHLRESLSAKIQSWTPMSRLFLLGS